MSWVYGQQVYEIFSVANIVSDTIVVPDTRAAEYREELEKRDQSTKTKTRESSFVR